MRGVGPLAADTLAEILDGGQAFRWNRIATAGADCSPPAVHATAREDFLWKGGWGEHVVELRLGPEGRVHWRTPCAQHDETRRALAAYFATDRDFSALADRLPWRTDAHLARCLAAFPGLRILRQPLGETLLGFLCSATKQIVQIKQMVALLARRHGAPLGADHRLPTWEELARVPERDLRACLLGFRARYIADTARFLAENPGWLAETEQAPYPEARDRLCTLPGVGAKIADCVLLFGAGRLEAFPVDTWILQALARRYGLDGWPPAQVAQFGRAHFGPLAGLAQQYLFAWERRFGRDTPAPRRD
ncbi:MAG: DNA-binding protein [Verrucomicrobia bacterium]|nr:DNA-binding protein [Verrucomicrobiota bacterium]